MLLDRGPLVLHCNKRATLLYYPFLVLCSSLQKNMVVKMDLIKAGLDHIITIYMNTGWDIPSPMPIAWGICFIFCKQGKKFSQ